ncbi:hypothetical protein FXO38_00299, partial [Capsicum annuum]
MYWVTAKNVVVSVPRWRSLSLFFRPPLRRRFYFSSTPHTLVRCREQIRCLKERKLFSTAAKKLKQPKSVPEEKDYVNIMWWKERMEFLRKPSSVLLAKRLTYCNVLGVDPSLRNGSLKEGTLNSEMLQ